MEQKVVVELDRYQRSAILNALNKQRNELLEQGLSTDLVDETLLLVMDAPLKKRNLILGKSKGVYTR